MSRTHAGERRVRGRVDAPRALGAAALATLLLAGCSSGRSAASALELQRVPLPALDAADQAVREQLEAAYAELLPLGERVGLADAERGAAYGELGELLMAASLATAAEPALLNARALAPADVRWPYYLGHLYRTGGNAAEAATMFEEAINLAPGDLAAHVWLGRVYLTLNRAGEAEAEFSRALAADPDSPAARDGLGQVALARGEYAVAVREFERVLATAPEASSAQYPLGLAYRGLGEEATARRHMAQRGDGEVALADPRMDRLALVLDSALAYQRRGLAAMEVGAWGEAAAQFRNGLAAAPEGDAALRVSLMHKLGSALSLGGDVEGAVEQFEAGISLSPEFAENHYSLGVILASRGDVDDARRRFETAITYDPDFVQARIALGNVLHGLGQPARALPHYAHVLSIAPDSGDARYAQAAALVDLGRYAEAREFLADGLQRHPDDPRFAEALGALLGF